LGANEIITVVCNEPPEAGRKPFPSFGRAVERTIDAVMENAYNVDRKLLLERNRLAALQGGNYRQVTLYEAIRPPRRGKFDAGSYLYFERRLLADMYAAGRRAARSWLAAGPSIDRLEGATEGAAA
jgi:hypothetical protein